ncbi:histone H1A, sperm-like [Belonocnema kinseyi]|uniref:histone H1A, sperm-like n=1 Tax=Belonocnema kinseyi TaxID=2817044 RepID=UPI00143DD32B|nr:histone H1A, sperm-like [Belonocnema kinseyi]
MADKIESSAAPAAVATPQKATVPKTKKARVAAKAAAHPPASEMVLAAVAALKEKKGSSLQAIKKYIVATYKIDAEKQAIFIRKYLKSAVASCSLVQTKGSGAAGSFKLPVGKTEAKPKSSKVAPKAKSASNAKKQATPKKAPKAKKTVGKKSTKVAAKPPKAKSTKPKAASHQKKLQRSKFDEIVMVVIFS